MTRNLSADAAMVLSTRTRLMFLLVFLFGAVVASRRVAAFTCSSSIRSSSGRTTARPRPTLLYTTKNDDGKNAADEESDELLLKAFVEEEYPAFYNLLSLNKGIWKTIADAGEVCTLFAPSNAVFDALGEKKLRQLKDVRNEETTQKMGLYHVIGGEAVSAVQLRTEDWTVKQPKGEPRPPTVQSVKTLGGAVPVGRSKSGGFLFGLVGAKEDGDIVIGSAEARIVKSYKVAGSYVHEVDALISPVILWRYMDQLSIPVPWKAGDK